MLRSFSTLIHSADLQKTFVDIGFNSILFSEQQGEIEAKFMVIVDKTEFEADPDSLTVEEALSKTVEAEKIGIFKVDRDSLSVGETGES